MRTSRRTFLKSAGGFLLVGYSRGGAALATVLQADGVYRDPDFKQLDSWIVIHEDSSATFYVGKTDCGQGTGTSFRQIMADELDVAYEKTTCIMGSMGVKAKRPIPIAIASATIPDRAITPGVASTICSRFNAYSFVVLPGSTLQGK